MLTLIVDIHLEIYICGEVNKSDNHIIIKFNISVRHKVVSYHVNIMTEKGAENEEWKNSTYIQSFLFSLSN